MEAEMIQDLNCELKILAENKGFRLSKTKNSEHYLLMDAAAGHPAINPDDNTPFFNLATAMQFLLESPDAAHVTDISHAA